MNGRPWTRTEIEELFRTVTQAGDTFTLSVKLDRTPQALIAKAKRLGVRPSTGAFEMDRPDFALRDRIQELSAA